MNTYDIAYTSSVITENCFNVVKRHLNTGVMATHEWIVKKAILFEEEHKEVSEWDEYFGRLENRRLLLLVWIDLGHQ